MASAAVDEGIDTLTKAVALSTLGEDCGGGNVGHPCDIGAVNDNAANAKKGNGIETAGGGHGDDHTVIIDIDEKVIKCDRRLLVQHSKYFEALFSFQGLGDANGNDDGKGDGDGGPAKKDQQRVRIKIKGGIDFDSARIIVSAMRGDDVLVNGENAQSILQASTFLQCSLAEVATADYIMSNVSLSNAFSAYLLAQSCGSSYLSSKAEAFIQSSVQTLNFMLQDGSRSSSPSLLDDVLQLPADEFELKALKMVQDNYVAFSLICGWILHDFEGGRRAASHLAGLMDTHVLAEIVPPDSIEHLADHLDEEDATLVVALEKSRAYEALPLREKIIYWDAADCYKDKKAIVQERWPKIAVVCSTGNNCSMITYRTNTSNKWLNLTSKPAKLRIKSSGSCVVVAGSLANPALFFIGGVGNAQMWSYSLRSDSWKLLPVEQEERIRPLVCSVGCHIYIFGGYSDRSKEVTYMDTASSFDCVSLRWTPLRSMGFSRSGGQACYFEGQIYLFGGLCSRRRALVSCEVYDVATDEYRFLTNLPYMIIDFGLVLLRKSRRILVIGGMDPLTFETKSTVLIFDIVTGQWHQDFPPLNVARKSCGCFFDGTDLYVVGGSTAELGQLSSVERFCPVKYCWKVVDSLPKGLAATTSAVVSELPVRLMANYRELGQSNLLCN